MPDNIWSWKTAIYVYANINEVEVDAEFESKIREALDSRYKMLIYEQFQDENLKYISSLMVDSKRLRNLIADLLNGLAVTAIRDYDKSLVSKCYTKFVGYCYLWISKERSILPLVICDDTTQLSNILPVIKICLYQREEKTLFLSKLNDYLKKLSQIDVNKKVDSRIKAFFQIITENIPQLSEDIVAFLKKSDCELANEIVNYLDKVSCAEDVTLEYADKTVVIKSDADSNGAIGCASDGVLRIIKDGYEYYITEISDDWIVFKRDSEEYISLQFDDSLKLTKIDDEPSECEKFKIQRYRDSLYIYSQKSKCYVRVVIEESGILKTSLSISDSLTNAIYERFTIEIIS
jgi:ribosomal protein S17E